MSQTPPIINNLVQKFERNIHEYRNPKYKEALIHVEFVNPFWKALGRDVDNEQGNNIFSQIDQLVYQLYGLTEEEIRIVEGKV
jgi:hypothetical protein